MVEESTLLNRQTLMQSVDFRVIIFKMFLQSFSKQNPCIIQSTFCKNICCRPQTCNICEKVQFWTWSDLSSGCPGFQVLSRQTSPSWTKYVFLSFLQSLRLLLLNQIVPLSFLCREVEFFWKVKSWNRVIRCITRHARFENLKTRYKHKNIHSTMDTELKNKHMTLGHLLHWMTM